MINLLSTLFQTINNATSWSVYFEQAPETTSLPYVVYKLPNSSDMEKDRQDFILEVDLWYKGTDSTTLEGETDNIDDVLENLRHLDSNQLLIFSRINRLMLPDPDPDIKRRQLRYEIKTYKR